jgi:hypothetical protein
MKRTLAIQAGGEQAAEGDAAPRCPFARRFPYPVRLGEVVSPAARLRRPQNGFGEVITQSVPGQMTPRRARLQVVV